MRSDSKVLRSKTSSNRWPSSRREIASSRMSWWRPCCMTTFWRIRCSMVSKLQSWTIRIVRDQEIRSRRNHLVVRRGNFQWQIWWNGGALLNQHPLAWQKLGCCHFETVICNNLSPGLTIFVARFCTWSIHNMGRWAVQSSCMRFGCSSITLEELLCNQNVAFDAFGSSEMEGHVAVAMSFWYTSFWITTRVII